MKNSSMLFRLLPFLMLGESNIGHNEEPMFKTFKGAAHGRMTGMLKHSSYITQRKDAKKKRNKKLHGL